MSNYLKLFTRKGRIYFQRPVWEYQKGETMLFYN